MDEELEMVLLECQEAMDQSIEHYVSALQKIRAGKASPAMVQGVMVEAYGAQSQLNTVASITASDARTITIQPFDKSVIGHIEKAIINSNLGFNPMNDGSVIRINIPPLTEERRRDLVKQVKNELENAKIGVRNARRDANEAIKKLVKDGLSEDLGKDGEAQIQEQTNKATNKLESLTQTKESEIMTV
ncbi:MAG: ribosome recycling factor [Bacteroidetes bacterium]|nr:ribosome recycling factor [Bacteroidota bacterium]